MSETWLPYLGVTAHARKRMHAHYNLLPEPEEWWPALLAIHDGRAQVIRIEPARGGGTNERHMLVVEIMGIRVPVVYEPATSVIVTVLPNLRRPPRERKRRPAASRTHPATLENAEP